MRGATTGTRAKRSGSERRQRTEQLGVRLHPEELERITAAAERANLSRSTFTRLATLALVDALARDRRGPVASDLGGVR